MNILQDLPLDDISQDRLGRENIVDLIVDSINAQVSTNHSCVVYGIYGKWGEGKTSLLRFVKNKLLKQGKEDGISLVEYNPWIVNNDEALVREFFKSIMSFPDQSVRKLFKKYGAIAIFASKKVVNAVAPGVGNTMAKGIKLVQKALEDSEDSLTELKKKVSDAMNKSKKHLVVMIDDVDRLDREEIHTVLRLIRQVADFPNCIYIVAMDVDMVSKAVGDYYGGGNAQDGRNFIDKIVQIPITLPHTLDSDLRQLVKIELTKVLTEYADEEQISDVVEKVLPFLDTIRSLIRYCNQLSFVLPNLKDEVNIVDLCIVEAIKNFSNTAYDRIYESRSKLLKESNSFSRLVDKEKSAAEVSQNYSSAKEYITEIFNGKKKEAILASIDGLFGNRSYEYQQDLDEKRIRTNEYFAKYFVQKVPENIIPDRVINELKTSIDVSNVNNVTCTINEWSKKYPLSEIKRAVIQLIRQFQHGSPRNMAASVFAKSLSVSELAKGLPEYTYFDIKDISTFVTVAIISRYMFVQKEETVGIFVWDEGILDETLKYIFSNAELNYCMNFLSSSESFLNTGSYDGRNAIPELINRFKELGFDEQFKFSKLLLQTLFLYWRNIDGDSFNEYAKDLFSNPEIPYLRIFDKLIDGTDDLNDSSLFVKLFYLQVPIINERIRGDVDGNPYEHKSVKIYSSNFRTIIENSKLG